MPNTYSLISSNVLSTTAASVTFSAIPATFTDLVLSISGRTNVTGQATDNLELRFNGSSSSIYSITRLRGNGSTASSSANSGVTVINGLTAFDAADATSNTFSSLEIYVPSYLASQNKPVSLFSAQEDNNTTANVVVTAGLWRDTSAITSIYISSNSGGSFVSGSSFYLYGIKNS
jgi:hypothetical protein